MFRIWSGMGPTRWSRWKILLAAAISAFLLGIAGWSLHRHLVEEATRDALEKMEAVIRLKVSQVAEWRQQLLGDVQANATGRFGMLVQEAARRGFGPEDLVQLRRRMEQRQAYRRYRDQILVGPGGDLVIRLRSDLPGLAEETRLLALKAMVQRKALLGEPRIGRLEDPILEAACPILGEDGTPLGVLVHQEDLDRLLFPLLENWPLPSRSAETQVVMRDGDHVGILNRQRNRPDPPLTARIPLSVSEDLRVQAVLGARGAMAGRDPGDGRPLLAYASTIPDSPWVLVAWMDQEEALEKVRWAGLLVWVNVGLAIVLTVGMALGLAWVSSRRGDQVLARQAREGERWRNLALGALSQGPFNGDGVVVCDPAGKVVQMNLFAERMTAWPGLEARGRPVAEVLALVEGTPLPSSDSPDFRSAGDQPRRVRLVSRDGTVRSVWLAIAPMQDESGVPMGSVFVFQDRSREEEAESETRAWASRYRVLFEKALWGVAWLDAAGVVVEANVAFRDLVGRPSHDIAGMPWQDLVAPVDRDGVGVVVGRLFSGYREPISMNLRYLRPDGQVVMAQHLVLGERDSRDRLVSILVQVRPEDGD